MICRVIIYDRYRLSRHDMDYTQQKLHCILFFFCKSQQQRQLICKTLDARQRAGVCILIDLVADFDKKKRECNAIFVAYNPYHA